MLFPALRLLCRLHLAHCLPKDLPSWKMGWGEAGRGWQAGGPLLPGFQLFCMTEEVPTARKCHALQAHRCPSRTWPRPRGACDSAVLGPGMPGMPGRQWQWQLDGRQGAEEVPRALMWGTGLGVWGQGAASTGLLCARGRSAGPKPGASRTGTSAPFPPGAVAARGPTLPPREECLPGLRQSPPCPALHPFSDESAPET